AKVVTPEPERVDPCVDEQVRQGLGDRTHLGREHLGGVEVPSGRILDVDAVDDQPMPTRWPSGVIGGEGTAQDLDDFLRIIGVAVLEVAAEQRLGQGPTQAAHEAHHRLTRVPVLIASAASGRDAQARGADGRVTRLGEQLTRGHVPGTRQDEGVSGYVEAMESARHEPMLGLAGPSPPGPRDSTPSPRSRPGRWTGALRPWPKVVCGGVRDEARGSSWPTRQRAP